MLPWAHLGFGYLLYSAGEHGHGARPTDTATIVLAIGTQFPDLIDKPLSWHLAVLPTGRSLGHSILVWAVLAVVVVYLARRVHRPALGPAFATGHLSHILGDAIYPLAAAEFEVVLTFLWPIVTPPYVEHEKGILEHLLSLTLTGSVLLGFGITAVAAVLWWMDGRPGLGAVRSPRT